LIEQLDLFGARDPFCELIDRIVDWYEDEKRFEEETDGYMPNFDDWLRRLFASYCGGNGASILWGCWTFYNFSPKGLRLSNTRKLVQRSDGKGTEYESIFFPKQKILKAFSVKDDGRDMMEAEE